MGQVLVFNLQMSPDQIEMCLPVLPLHLPHGILSQKGPDTLNFNGVVPSSHSAPTQADMIADTVRHLNAALDELKAKEDAEKTPPSSQTSIQKAPRFGPVQMNDR